MANEADAIEDGLEAMLAMLRPKAAGVDPLVAAYAAGAAAGRRGVNRWRGAAASAAAVAILPLLIARPSHRNEAPILGEASSRRQPTVLMVGLVAWGAQAAHIADRWDASTPTRRPPVRSVRLIDLQPTFDSAASP